MRKDCTIIGGGAIGLAIAFRLKKTYKDKTVTVINNREKGSASLASGAMLGCFGEVTKYTLSSEAGTQKFALMYEAHKQWNDWRNEIEADAKQEIKYIPGSYVILNSHGGALDDENFDAMIDALDKYNEPYETVAPKDIPGLHANELARPLRAVHLPNEGSIDSNQYVQVLEMACKNIGVEVVDIETLHQIERADGLYTVTFDNESFESRSIVLATGAYTSKVLEKMSPAVPCMPVFAGNGVATVTKRQVGEGFTATVRTANRAGSCGLHVVPLGDGYEYLGATNVLYNEPETRMTVGLSHFLSQCAIEQLDTNIYHSFVETWRVGNRPVSLDTLPLIGNLGEEGLYLATGTYRDGLHCSPVIAGAIAEMIEGEIMSVVEPFAPSRPFTQLMDKEASIAEYAMQAVSGAYENWYRPTYYMNDDGVYDAACKKARDIYDELQTDIGLHPDILLLLSSDKTSIVRIKDYLRSIKEKV